MMEEDGVDEVDDDGNTDDEDENIDNDGEQADNINADDFVFPQNMDMEELEKAAEVFSKYVKNLDADALSDMEESTEWFLKDKGFYISTLSGCKAAQAWLEKAQPNDAFVTEGPIDNSIDWHMGKARLDSMLKIVKAQIKKIEGE